MILPHDFPIEIFELCRCSESSLQANFQAGRLQYEHKAPLDINRLAAYTIGL
jgi:hypothetical protein